MMPDIDRRLAGAMVVAMLLCFGAGYQYGISVESKRSVQASLVEAVPDSGEAATELAGPIYVYVAGEVAKPGVLEMQEGDRVFHALEKTAPGPEADLSSLNLAAAVADGEKIVVPRLGDTRMESTLGSNQPAGVNSSGLLNINTASVGEIDSRLPGIGPALAQRVVDYREQNGGFKAIEEIKEVAGIGDKRFTEMKELICVR